MKQTTDLSYSVLHREACDLMKNPNNRCRTLEAEYRALHPNRLIEAGVADSFQDYRGFTTLILEVRQGKGR